MKNFLVILALVAFGVLAVADETTAPATGNAAAPMAGADQNKDGMKGNNMKDGMKDKTMAKKGHHKMKKQPKTDSTDKAM